ncbi:MAG TPA: DUF2723 domain-containing protein [Candidatus Sulfomarinibacteraceae bacterium]|nr:DUF2723 domain-containing protein [Candidatus Sulfomarinibacteraceae bacterium]
MLTVGQVAGLSALFAGICAFLLYLSTLAPDLAWDYHGADGGELITAAVTLGVPHPPGYPLYTILGRLVAALPFGTVAYRFNLLSALCMSVAVTLSSAAAFFVLQQSVPRSDLERRSAAMPILAATTAGLVLALLPLVWQQALIAEVYGLNLLLLSAFLFQLVRQGKEHNGWLAGLFLGLAITGHLTSLFMAPLAAVGTARARWPRLAAGAAAGASPYLLLPLLAAGESPILWGDPTTLRGWWWLVSARIYRPNVLAVGDISWPQRAALWLGELSIWFLAVATFLLFRDRRRLLRPIRSTGLVMLATAALYGLYALTYDAPNALVYLLPALLLVSILMGRIYYRLGPLALILPLALLMLNFNRLDLSKQDQARRLTMPVLQEAPPDAVLLTDGDRATFTLWYLHYVEGMRPDLILVDRNLLAFDWYRRRLKQQHPDLRQLGVDDLALFQEANIKFRPLCSLTIEHARSPTAEFFCLEA